MFCLPFCFFAIGIQPVIAQKNGEKKISIQATNQSVENVLKELSRKTDLKFFYGETVIHSSDKISLQIENQPLDEILKEITRQTSFEFFREDNTITVVIKQNAAMQEAVGRKIKGTVIDETGEPVVGANVVATQSNRGTITDVNGEFEVEITADEPLKISYIGYTDKIVRTANQQLFHIQLEEDAQALEEVVIVGYGTQKKVNLTGAITTVDAKKLENRPITNATQALQGAQGLYVNQARGQPGSEGATIHIRGVGTLNNNDPLILVDGIEYSLDAINPNDIESITVLKDAASSAIYGSRAANGVVLVTTKGAKKGEFSVEYNNYFGAQRATYLPRMVYDPVTFMEYRNQAQRNEGSLTVDYSDELIAEYKEGMKTDAYTYPSNNWMDIMFNDAFIMEHNVRFSADNEKYMYALSVGYLQQDRVLRGTDAQKYTISYNSRAFINDRLTIGNSMHVLYNVSNQPAAGVANLMEMTFKASPFHPTYLEDGRYADTFIRTPGHNVYRHPLALADEGENQTKNQQILLHINAEYKLPWNINYKLNLGVNKKDYLQSIFVPQVYKYQVKTLEAEQINFNGMPQKAYKKDTNDMDKTLFMTFDWQHTFQSDHHLTLLGGYSYEDFNTSWFSAQNEEFLGNGLTELDAGSANPAVEGTSGKSVLMSYFGRANYDYQSKYLVEANFRYDGSSRFAKGNRWGLFPSFSAGWRISEEGFMAGMDWLDNLKFRGSWGQLGNERIDMFRYVDLIDLGYIYPFNGTVTSGAAVVNYNDPDITWETTTMSNLAVDATFLNGKLDFSFELFHKRTTDILATVELPQQVGSLGGPIQNIGTVVNKGLEVALAHRNTIRDFRYGVSGSMALLKNRITDLRGETYIDGRFIRQEGASIDSYYMLHAIGIFQSQEEIDNSPFQTADTKPGYLKFEDVDGDGKITDADCKIVGSSIPPLTYSFTINLGYKNVDLSMFFQGVQGLYSYGDQICATPFWFGCGLPVDWVDNSWTPERGTSATLPILTTYEGAQNENFRANSFWLRNCSYLRMKNIQLTYNVPSHILRKAGIKKMKVFVNGANLLTFSPMNDFDPEKNISGGNWYEYPSVKSVTGGMNITF